MLLHGGPIASKIYEDLQSEITNSNLKLTLGVILVGDSPESLRYINQKKKFAEKIGARFILKKFDIAVTEQELIEQLKLWNNDTDITGYIVQFPLPPHLDETQIVSHIDPLKDIDGFHPINQGKMLLGDTNALYPCTPSGIIHLLEQIDFEFAGKFIAVIGRSNIVGKPVAALAINKGATVVVCNSKTKNMTNLLQSADVIISAAGVPRLIDKSVVKNDAIIIDVGFTILEDKIYGDVDAQSFDDNDQHIITPVPGGVGRLTVAFLLKNLLKAYYLQSNNVDEK